MRRTILEEVTYIVVLDVQGLFETGPLVLSEEATEVRLADVAILVGADGLHGICIVVVKGEASRNVFLQTSGGVGEILGDVVEQVSVSDITDKCIVVIEARVITSQGVVLRTSLGNDQGIEQRAVGELGKLSIRNSLETGPKETKGPVDLAVVDTRLASRPKQRLEPSSAIGHGSIVRQLTGSSIIKASTIAIPERNTRAELCRRPEASQVTLPHDVAVRIEKGQRSSKLGACVLGGGGEVEYLLSKVLIVQTVIKVCGWETIGVSLQSVDLFDLAAIWQADIIDAKVRLCIVRVGRDLAWKTCYYCVF